MASSASARSAAPRCVRGETLIVSSWSSGIARAPAIDRVQAGEVELDRAADRLRGDEHRAGIGEARFGRRPDQSLEAEHPAGRAGRRSAGRRVAASLVDDPRDLADISLLASRFAARSRDGWKTSTEARPWRLHQYSAASACAYSWVRVVATRDRPRCRPRTGSGAGVARLQRRARGVGGRVARRRRRRCGASARRTRRRRCGTRGRRSATHSPIRRPMSRSISSPAAWPPESLTSLRSSRSISSSATGTR